MKKILISLLLASFSVNAYAETAQTVKFDLDKSKLIWAGKKVTGSHQGELKLKSAKGEIHSDGALSGSFDIDMSSLKVTDIETPKDNKKLVNHLQSPDFFKVQEYPTVSFKITKSAPIAAAKAGEANTAITGDLSIKGVTKTVTFPAIVEAMDGIVSAKGTATVDRTQFDVRYGSGKFFQGLGDKLIYDDFTVDVELIGTVS